MSAVRSSTIRGMLVLAAFLLCASRATAQTDVPSSPARAEVPPVEVEQGFGQPLARFKAGVELVRITAVVRDRKGRFVRDLSARDFEVLDSGQPRRIADCRSELGGVSVALLFDVSGSMESRLADAREAAEHVLAWLDPQRDEAAVFAFDTALRQIAPFVPGLKTLPATMSGIEPFGATSLYDAIAQTAERSATREGRRWAVVVMTDGNDNASRLTPSDVSGIASAIDVPVYVFGIVAGIDDPAADIAASTVARSPFADSLLDLANWTGGQVFVASAPAQRSIQARALVDELRHQYLLAFESSGDPGWHPLSVRTRDKGLIVRARSGYIVGQPRQNSY
jgi:Ca-activated chloride channel homolog